MFNNLTTTQDIIEAIEAARLNNYVLTKHDISYLKYILKNLRSKEENQEIAYFCAKSGLAFAVKILIPHIDLNYRYPRDGHGLIHLAVLGGHTHVLSVLIHSPEVDVNLQTLHPYRHTALSLACVLTKLDCVQLLLSAGAAIRLSNSVDGDALVSACQQDSMPIIEALLDCGANVNTYNTHQSPLLNEVCKSTASIEIGRTLLARGADVNEADSFGTTVLHSAFDPFLIFHDHATNFAKFMIDAGTDVNATNAEGDSPLTLAQHDRYLQSDITALLIDNGATLLFRATQEDEIQPIYELARTPSPF